MPSKLERKWWFIAPVSAMAALSTAYVMDSAGIAYPYGWSQWVLYVLAFAGFERGFALVAWLIALLLPRSNMR